MDMLTNLLVDATGAEERGTFLTNEESPLKTQKEHDMKYVGYCYY